ncbi:MAG: cation:proton antiporter [Bacteroidales bacterium]
MLTSIAFIFVSGLGLGYISTKLKLPALVGLLFTGVILGPYVLNAISPNLLIIGPDLRKLALIIILTRAGLSLNIGDLKKVGRPALLMCFVPACFEIIATTLFAPLLLNISILEAAIMGTVIAAVSPAVIVPKMIHLIENKYGTTKSIPQMIMAGGSIDDVFVIVLFTSFITLASGETLSALTWAKIPVSITTGILSGILLGGMFSLYFKRFHLRDSAKVILLLSSAFLIMAFEQATENYFPFSGLLAVMSIGGTLLFTYPALAQRLSQKYGKLWVAAEIMLFVLVGATIDMQYALASGVPVILLIFIALVFRMGGVFVSTLRTSLTLKERLFCMIAYTPKATVQAAIGSIPLGLGLPCGQIVLTVAVLAILITAPLGAFAMESTYKKLLTKE